MANFHLINIDFRFVGDVPAMASPIDFHVFFSNQGKQS
jgi:hypothetical protein